MTHVRCIGPVPYPSLTRAANTIIENARKLNKLYNNNFAKHNLTHVARAYNRSILAIDISYWLSGCHGVHSQAGRQPRTFFEVPYRNLPLTNPNPCNAFLCKHKSALHLPFWPFGPKRQGWEKICLHISLRAFYFYTHSLFFANFDKNLSINVN